MEIWIIWKYNIVSIMLYQYIHIHMRYVWKVKTWQQNCDCS